MGDGVKLKLIRLPVGLYTRLVRQAGTLARQRGQRVSVNAVILDILTSHFGRTIPCRASGRRPRLNWSR
jgi:hypothetical protein